MKTEQPLSASVPAAPETRSAELERRRPAPPMYQYELPLIEHEVEHALIQQRALDGYINATAMCRAAGRQLGSYLRTETTKAFLEELSSDVQICTSDLVQSVRGGIPELQGTWVHPRVAIHLAQWLSPVFAVKVSEWVFSWMTGQAAGSVQMPDHVRRYMVNRSKIPPTHFSMLDQMTLRVLAPLEQHGYILPGDLMPDISLGRIFSNWLRKRGHDPDGFPSYDHEFLDHRPTIPARLYPNQLLTEFNLELEAWLKDGRARKYFAQRDQSALPALDKVLLQLPSPEPPEDDPDAALPSAS